jgi:uncharacterized protein YdeI (YjbR/CyaY-like superfamily)
MTASAGPAAEPEFFATPKAFRAWLRQHHAGRSELLVGFWKKHTGKPSLTWPQSVDEALCFGWIDGIRRSLGEDAYSIRFSPRRPRSTWSAVNLKRMGELIAEGRVHPAGMAAFERRSDDNTAIYAYEQRGRGLDEPYASELRAHARAWEYFQAQRPGYRKTVSWWVMSAKRDDTRRRRLARLIEACAAGEWIAALKPPGDAG